MESKNNLIFPLAIYSDCLTTIDTVSFSKREIEIIACILDNRSSKEISRFLDIAPKTAEVHVHNIMKKLNFSSKKDLVRFIQTSDKFFILKKYYPVFLTQILFEKTLKHIASLHNNQNRICFLYCKSREDISLFLEQIKNHLTLAGIKTSIKAKETLQLIDLILQNSGSGADIIYIVQKASEENELRETLKQTFINNEQHAITPLILWFVKEERTDSLNSISNGEVIDFSEDANYYSSFFEVLKTLLPHLELADTIEEFKQKQELIINQPLPNRNRQGNEGGGNPLFSFLLQKIFSLKRPWNVRIIIMCLICLLSMGLFTFTSAPKKILTPLYSEVRSSEPSIRSDLIIPNETILLNRLELIKQIDQKFKADGGIQTVALVGIGGAGKTTLARQYASQEERSLVWEINAETDTSLIESFEKLAEALSKNDQEYNKLRKIKELINSLERTKKIIQFVKEGLKSHSGWLLIYDNLENFGEAQKYFPQDSNTWGNGNIILTTQNENIKNNNSINNVILIEELNEKQKFDFFIKIMDFGERKQLTATQREEIIAFLKHIPPFPLDISVVAYYLKTIDVPYERYLEHLKHQDRNFSIVQKNLLKEAGAYEKTRYSIITLSLEKLMAADKNFADLLLLISILDSQNIPRDLLDLYKGKSIVDNFIYNLKKYSLITSKPSKSSLGAALSIHRSTHAIVLAYLTKTLDLEKNKNLLLSLGSIFENYVANILEKEGLEDAAFLNKHCEKFLSHKDLLTEFIEGAIESKWGEVCYFLYNYNKATKLLEESLPKLKKYSDKNPSAFAWSLARLGNIYRIAGKFEDAKKVLEQSLRVYKKHSLIGTPHAAFALAHLGNIYRELGDYKKAENLYAQSLEIYTNCFSKNHIKVAWNLMHLGYVYNILGDYKKSQDFYEKGLSVYKQHFPESHAKIGWCLLSLGKLYLEIGSYKKAQKLCTQSLAIYKKHCEDSIDVAETLAYLGNIYSNMGKNGEAKQLLEKSVKYAKKHLSENDPKVKWILAQLGSVYKELGNYEEAKSLLENSLLVYQNHYGKDHIKTASILETLGQVYFLKNNLQVAEEFFFRALSIWQKNNHPSAYKGLESLAEVHLKKSEEAIHKKDVKSSQIFRAQALNDLKKALEIVKAHFPPNSPQRARIELKLRDIE